MTDSLIARPIEGTQKPDTEYTNPAGEVETGEDTGGSSKSDTSSKSKSIDWEKRYKDLQSFHSRREAELRKRLEELEKKNQSFVAPTTPEELEAFKRRNPELYNMILSLAHEQVSSATRGISEKMEVFEQELIQAEREKALQKIREAHPDYQTIVADPAFHDWVAEQPIHVQKWVYENPDDPDLAIIALDRYKATRDSASKKAEHPEKEATTKKKAADTSAAEAVSSGGAPDVQGEPKIWKASEIKKMSSEEFRKYEKEIDRAYLEGRVDFKS